jgi:hypothetical protein
LEPGDRPCASVQILKSSCSDSNNLLPAGIHFLPNNCSANQRERIISVLNKSVSFRHNHSFVKRPIIKVRKISADDDL